jgi:dTDP-4-dehydrorhamnose 3,5-epimerase
MKVTPLSIEDVLLIEPNLFEDDRGFFFESFNLNEFRKATSLNINFAQDNHSKSVKGVLRGLHYQVAPYAQGKLVRVAQGETFNVAVDLRKCSLTFGKYISETLSAENKKQLWIPEGFAHGFLTLSDSSDFLYKATGIYSSNHERCILWNDKTLNINWPIDIEIKLKLSKKDSLGTNFNCCELFP